MSIPAIEKAESLYKFANSSGYPLNTFALVLSESEAVELLEWYAAQYQGTSEAFDLDIIIARRTGNPWPVLSNFHCMGLEIAKANLVLN
jgi:hypothetical protein